MSEINEVDFFVYARELWSSRKRLLKFLILFTLIGLIVALLQRKEYRAESIFIPQIETNSSGLGGSIGGLASLAGIDIQSASRGSVDFPPTLYPNLLENIDLQLDLLNSKIYVKSIEDSVSYRVFYDSIYRPSVLSKVYEYTFGLPALVISSIRSDEGSKVNVPKGKYYRITSSDHLHLKRLKKSIKIVPDMDEGYVSLSFIMNDANHAAQMAGHLEKLIHEALIDYRLEKINQELGYLSTVFSNKKQEFIDAQNSLSDFMDKNLVLSTAASKNELNRLQNNYDLAFEIYKDLAASVEQKKIERSKKTPLIKTIKPIVVPFEKASPNRPMTLILFFLLGLGLGVFIILVLPRLKTAFYQKNGYQSFNE